MAISYYPNGAGGTTGADLAVLKRISKSGYTYFIGNAVSGASDSHSGLDRAKPLLTTAQAYTNIAAGDTVVYLANHNETIATVVTLAKAGISLVGEGSGSTVPRLTCNGTVGAALDITAAGVLLDNLYFPPAIANATVATVRVGAADVRLNALQFDLGAADAEPGLAFVTGASSCTLTNSRFTAVAATPVSGIEITNAIAGLTMDRVTFDAGSFEWSVAAFNGNAAVTRLRATRMYMLAGSDVLLSTGSTGDWQTEVATGNSRLNWTV
jgi:hypothetical protein